MTGTLIYWTLQIAIWIVCVIIFIRRKEISEKHQGRKDSPLQKLLLLILTPIFAFAYACLDGYPPKDSQIHFILALTILVYCTLIARWIRQNRQST